MARCKMCVHWKNKNGWICKRCGEANCNHIYPCLCLLDEAKLVQAGSGVEGRVEK